jgi:surfeit locus 1 family protein
VFDLEWRTTLLTVLLLPLLVALGFWQLERADEKRQLAGRNAERAALAPVSLADLAALDPGEQADRRVRLQGHMLASPQLFVDNQLRGGRYGHDVISLFVDEASGRTVLLNRGWVPGDPARRSLPEIDVPRDELRLMARVYVSPGDPYVLEEERFDSLADRMLVQQAGSPALRAALAAAVDGPLFEHELRLLPGQPAGFRRDWPLMNVSPAKHQGYALQWFTMAAALVLLFLLRSSNLATFWRRRDAADSQET